MPLVALAWLFTLGVLVHNIEEALYFPAWSARAGRWHAPVGPSEFRFAVAVFSMSLVAIAATVSTARPGDVSAYLFSGYVLAMVLNAFAPHLVTTLATSKYMPGTATAALFNLPLGCLFLKRALSANYIEFRTFAWSGPAVVLAIVASIPLLFAVGRKVGS